MSKPEFTVEVNCTDEALAERYNELAGKMADDKDFTDRLKECKSEEAVYELYKEKGYTDLPYEEFLKQLSTDLQKLHSQMDEFDLTEEELEGVSGGFNAFRFATTVVSCIPIAGPIIAGVAKSVKAGIDGKGTEGVTLEMAKATGLSLVDAIVMISGSSLKGKGKWGLMLGSAAMKAGLNEAEL